MDDATDSLLTGIIHQSPAYNKFCSPDEVLLRRAFLFAESAHIRAPGAFSRRAFCLPLTLPCQEEPMPEPITKRSIPVPPSLQLFTITETAVILGVSRRLVSNWIQEGALPAIRLGPGQRLVRVNIGDLEAFIAQARKKGVTLHDFQEADRALGAKLAAEAAEAKSNGSGS
jgi:excisionase family DNA binding protein